MYYVNGILNTKGQQLIGGWKISTSRYNLGTVSVDNNVPSTDNYIRMIYLETAYDLVELLHIKALGYNMINHYVYFKNNCPIIVVITIATCFVFCFMIHSLS